VNPRGDAVIAGRASPNAAVVVRDGQQEVGTAKADARGEWVVIPERPLAKGSRELTLTAKSRDGAAIPSDRNVVIMVPDRTPRKDVVGGTKRAPPGALAVLVPRKGNGGSIVIQKPSEAGQASLGSVGKQVEDEKPARIQQTQPVSIDAVDYDKAGNVTISGNAATDAPLTVYIDNQHAASGASDRQGRWRVVPGGALEPGIHILRVDQIGTDGKVVGRAETQFTRAKPAESVPDDSVVHVEPGNSLWRIARRVYGRGVQYSVIFDANRDQIRDPDLIYPGQVFFVPHEN
jgi:LysM repeat protein